MENKNKNTDPFNDDEHGITKRDYDQSAIYSNLSFGAALMELRQGCKLSRTGWNGKGMYIYFVGGRELPVESMRGGSEMSKHLGTPTPPSKESVKSIKIHSHIDMKTADGSVSIGWRPTNPDMFTNDWFIVE